MLVVLRADFLTHRMRAAREPGSIFDLHIMAKFASI
jgi:hypothetical protein